MKVLSVNLVILIILLLAVELFLKITHADYLYYERTYAAKFPEKAIHQLDSNWVKTDQDLGWVCRQKEKLKFYKPEYFDCSYQINQEGFRMSQDIEGLSASPKKRILLLGDSFLFGIFLKNNQTISAQLQAQLGDNYEVFNLAIPGWGIDQMYQAYQKYVQIIQPTQVMLIFIDDDIRRTVEAFFWGAATKNAYRLEQGKLVFRTANHGELNAVESFFVFNTQIVNRLYQYWHLLEAERLSKAILRQLISDEKYAHRKLTAFRIPRQEQVDHPNLQTFDLSPFFEEQQLDFFDFEKPLKQLTSSELKSLYIPNDDHLSEKGAALIQDKLKEWID